VGMVRVEVVGRPGRASPAAGSGFGGAVADCAWA
jgi:hypothetical protein